MPHIRSVLYLVLSVLAVCTAFNTLVPVDKELVYDYRATVQSGTSIPTSFLSDFYLHGKIHVQSTGSKLKFRFAELQMSMYNGEAFHMYHGKAKFQPLPEEMKDLYKPFEVHYEDSGVVDAFVTTKGEKEFVKNIKRAVASIFQLDVHRISFNKHHSFFTHESSIYGVHEMAYNVVPHSDHVIVHKAHNMKSMNHMYPFEVDNIEPEYCEVPYEIPLSHDMQRTYRINVNEDKKIVQSIYAFGGYVTYPFDARSDTQFLYSNQTFNLEEVKPVEKVMEVEDAVTAKNIGYKMFDDEENDVMDIFHGRRSLEIKSHIPMLYNMIEDVIKYLNKNHLTTEVPDVAHGQMINRIVRFMLYFKHTDFEQVYNTLSEKTSEHDKQMMEIFQQIVPLVGSHSSVVFVKDLIHQKKVKDFVAISMLHKLPFNIKMPSIKLLEEIKDMVEWDETISYPVRKAAILAFSSLIEKTYAFDKRMHYYAYDSGKDEENVHEIHSPEQMMEMNKMFFEKHPAYNKFLQLIVNKFKTASTIDAKILGMAALQNTKFDSILQYFEPILKGEEKVSDDERIYAIYASLSTIAKDPVKVFELYWPIFTDRTLPVDMRIAAYFAIMESHPPMSLMLNIYWFMRSEDKTSQLYKYHYDYIRSMSQTTDVCHYVAKGHAATLLKYTSPPMFYGMEGYYKLDYFDRKFDFSDDYQGMYMSTKKAQSFIFMHYSQIMGVLTNPMTIMVRVYGMEEAALRNLHLNHENTKEMFNFEELYSIYKNIRSKKDIKIELVMLQHGQVIQVSTIDSNNMSELTWFIQMWQQPSVVKKFIDINYEYHSTILVPNDIGFPTKIDTYVPSVKYFKINMSKTHNGMSFNNEYKLWTHSWRGISFYNPFADVWQGIARYHSLDFSLPLYFDVDVKVDGMRLNFKRFNDKTRDVMGVKSHVQSMVYIIDDYHHDVLKKSCDFCQPWVEVTKLAKNNYTIMDTESKYLGLRTQMITFDNEIGSPDEKTLPTYLLKTDNKNFMTGFGHWFLARAHFNAFLTYHPLPLTNGILYKTFPSETNPISDIEINFRFNQEVSHEPAVTLPGLKLTMYGSFMAKSDDGKPVTSAVVDTRIDLKPGHKISNYKMQVSYLDPEVGNKILSVDGNRKFHDNKDSGRMTVALRNSVDEEATKANVILDVTVEGTKSDEHHTSAEEYGECIPQMLTYPRNYLPDYYTKCASRVDAISNYIYNVKLQNVPDFMNVTLDDVLKMSFSMFQYNGKIHKEYVDDKNVKINLEFPIQGEQILGQLSDSHGHPFFKYLMRNGPVMQHRYPLLEIPIGTISLYGLRPRNLRFSPVYEMMYGWGMIKTCEIDHDQVKIDTETIIPQKLSQEWVLYGGNSEKDPKCGFFLKESEGKMALKVVFEDKNVEVYPVGDEKDHFKVMVNGKVMDYNQRHYSEDAFAIAVSSDYVDVLAYDVGVNFIYTDHSVRVFIPNHSGHFSGVCHPQH